MRIVGAAALVALFFAYNWIDKQLALYGYTWTQAGIGFGVLAVLALAAAFNRGVHRSRASAAAQARIAHQFPGKLAGVSHRNDDGKFRQKLITDQLSEGDMLQLRREPANQKDPNAIAVLSPRGQQLGWLEARVAADVTGWIEEGYEVTVKVLAVTGGTPSRPTRGVNIEITVSTPEAGLPTTPVPATATNGGPWA